MNLTLEITDIQLINLDKALRISKEDYNRLRQNGGDGETDYAASIMTARNILNLTGCPVIPETVPINPSLAVVAGDISETVEQMKTVGVHPLTRM